jgi:hypothetical protein
MRRYCGPAHGSRDQPRREPKRSHQEEVESNAEVHLTFTQKTLRNARRSVQGLAMHAAPIRSMLDRWKNATRGGPIPCCGEGEPRLLAERTASKIVTATTRRTRREEQSESVDRGHRSRVIEFTYWLPSPTNHLHGGNRNDVTSISFRRLRVRSAVARDAVSGDNSGAPALAQNKTAIPVGTLRAWSCTVTPSNQRWVDRKTGLAAGQSPSGRQASHDSPPLERPARS